ncbi:MAG: hypothetical protein IT342_06740 [Candidatus Melainabacteria bacterium]|nr:hypothetical protein [Candidatus Melainabacteria bacterium]
MTSALQFPNARLFIHNLLAFEHVTGAEAIARGAQEFGVISEASLSNPELMSAVKNCDCCAAAHCILLDYFKNHGEGSDGPAVENSWNTVLKRLCRYRVNATLSAADVKDNPDCRKVCSNLAPVIFDLLLQEVRRNS